MAVIQLQGWIMESSYSVTNCMEGTISTLADGSETSYLLPNLDLLDMLLDVACLQGCVPLDLHMFLIFYIC